MNLAGRIGVFLLMWIVLPVLFGIAGYYLIGPQLGKDPLVRGFVPRNQTPPQARSLKIDPDMSKDAPLDVKLPAQDRVRRFDEPEVEISVSELRRRRRSSSKRTTASKPKENTPVEQPAPKPVPETSPLPPDPSPPG